MEWDTRFDEWLALKRVGIARKLLRNHDTTRILDLGCGANLPLLRKIMAEHRVGADLQVWHQWKERGGIDVLVHQVDERGSLPFRADVFDAVTLLAVLEHISPDAADSLLIDVGRVMRAQGRVVITTPPRRTDRMLPLLGRMGLISKESPAEHKATYSKVELHEMLTKAGYADVEVGSFEVGMNLWASGIKPPAS